MLWFLINTMYSSDLLIFSTWTQVTPASDSIRMWTKLEFKHIQFFVCAFLYFLSISPFFLWVSVGRLQLLLLLLLFLVFFSDNFSCFVISFYFYFFFLSISYILRKAVRRKYTNITTKNRVKHINRTEMSKNAVKQQRVCYYWKKNRTNQRLMSECVHVE